MGNNANVRLYDVATGHRLYTVPQAARFLRYHPFSVYRLVFRGALRHRKLGEKTLLFRREDLMRYQAELSRKRPDLVKTDAVPAPSKDPVSVEVTVDLGDGTGPQAVMRNQGASWREFRWEHIPLIRETLGDRYGKKLKGLRISVRTREGGDWTVIYRGEGRVCAASLGGKT